MRRRLSRIFADEPSVNLALRKKDIGGFGEDLKYWSSSEIGQYGAQYMRFGYSYYNIGNKEIIDESKLAECGVRAVRTF